MEQNEKNLNRKLYEMLKKQPMTQKEICKLFHKNNAQFQSFIATASCVYPIYEEGQRNIIYGAL